MSRKHASKLSTSNKISLFLQIDEEIKAGSSMRYACRKIHKNNDLSISLDALMMRYRRYLGSGKRIHGNTNFTIRQEEEMVGMLEAFSLLHRGLSRSMFIKHIKMQYNEPIGWNPSKWVTGFLFRHKERLALRHVKGLKYDRIVQNIDKRASHFAQWMENYLLKCRNKKILYVNADETFITVQGNIHQEKLIECKKKPKNTAIEVPRGKSCSYLPFITNNRVIMSVFILKLNKDGSSNMKVKIARESSDTTHPVYYIYTAKGWLTAEAWYEILKVFHEQISHLFKKMKVFLFLDRLSCHMKDVCLQFTQSKGITTIFFPSASTHFLQPLDQEAFACFKNKMYSMLDEKLVSVKKEDGNLNEILFEIAHDAEAAMTPQVLARSFEKSGIYPFNKEIIIKNAKRHNSEMDDENESSYSNNVKRMVMEVIKQHTSPSTSVRSRVNPVKNRLYSGDEIIKMQQEKSKKQPSTPPIKSRPKNTSQMKTNSPRKVITGKMKETGCFCTAHNQFGTSTITKEGHCGKCHSYIFCTGCLNECIEQFIMHEESCSEKSSKKQKKN